MSDTEAQRPQISVICPLFNEEGNVLELHRKIKKSLDEIGRPYEIIFINDGSTDKTEERMAGLTPLTSICFRKNFGQTAALDCGIKAAKGDIIITLDGDLQNDPRDFKKLIKKLEEGYDIVSGWRKKRKDPWSKKFLSRGADFLRKFLIDDGIHDSGCTLKAYKKESFEGVDLYGEMHRFIPAILKIRGFSVAEIEVDHHPRASGRTKYTWTRTIKGFLDMLSVWFWKKYANRPLHLFGGAGLILSFFGFALFVVLVVLRFFYGVSLSDKIWPMVAVFLVLAGMQFFISGLLADIAVKNSYNGSRGHYLIKKIVKK